METAPIAASITLPIAMKRRYAGLPSANRFHFVQLVAPAAAGGDEVEAVVLLEKRHVSASRCATFRLVFRTLIESAEATDVLSLCVQQEDVNLMMRDAELLLMPESLQCSRRKPSKIIQVADTIEPHCQVNVFGFVHETSPPPI